MTHDKNAADTCLPYDATARNLAKLPEMCAVFQRHNPVGQRICMIKRGESGYYATDWDGSHMTPDQAEWTVNEINSRLEVTAAQALAMVIGSMNGWHVPGADPDRHTARAFA